MRIFRAILLAGVLCAVRTAPFIAQQAPQTPRDLPTLTIVAPEGLQADAAYLERLDRTRLLALMRLVGLERAGPTIQVLLAEETSDLARQTPDWIAGFADSASSTIVLFPRRAPSYPHDSMEALLHHEVAHILIARAAGGTPVPRWFHEGLALAAERSWGFTDRTRLAVAVFGTRRSIAAINADFDGRAGSVTRAYAISGAFVRDLLQRYGGDMAARLLDRMAAGATFEQAFTVATSDSMQEAERLFWRDSWWYQVIPFITSSVAIWMAIMFLALAAMRRRAQHRAAQRRAWDAEELLEQDLLEKP